MTQFDTFPYACISRSKAFLEIIDRIAIQFSTTGNATHLNRRRHHDQTTLHGQCSYSPSVNETRILERKTHKTRADTCIIIFVTGKQYIHVAIEKPAAASYLSKSSVDALGFERRGLRSLLSSGPWRSTAATAPCFARMQRRTSTTVSP